MNRINKEIWLIDSFSIKNLHPAWNCPICNTGSLRGDKNSIKIEQSQDTIKARRSNFHKADGVGNFRFAGFLICGNNACKEKVAIIGDGKLYSLEGDALVSIHYKGKRYSVYYPKYFEPSLNIFNLYDSCPKNIKEQIKLSFSHYFNDLSASANSMRTALELIMNDRKVQKTKLTKKGSRHKLSLHARLNAFGQKYNNLKPFLIAAKWIGNAGSHAGNLTKNDLLDGYQLLQYCLEELYDNPARIKELNSKAKIINKKKKPIHSNMNNIPQNK